MRVIFNADDYGVHPSISRGIREAIEHGVVRSTSVLANCATEEELALLARLVRRGTSAGVHLNLTRGRPLTAFPQSMLLPEGDFDRSAGCNQTVVPTLPDRLLMSEFRAQIKRVLPLAPTHLDGHHHIHTFWNTFAVACRLAKRHRLAMRAVNADMRKALRRRHISCPDHFVSRFFGKNNLSVDNLMALLEEPLASGAAAVEVMCHPGRWGRLPVSFSSYRRERERELAILTSPELKRALTRARIEVASYHEL